MNSQCMTLCSIIKSELTLYLIGHRYYTLLSKKGHTRDI